MLLIRTQHDAVFRHHIGTIREISDFPETLCFTLGEEISVRDVQTHQRGIFFGLDQGLDFQHHMIRRIRNPQRSGAQAVLALAEGFTIHPQRN